MAKLHPLHLAEPATAHAVFFHGLGADHQKTWSVDGRGGVAWPVWLAGETPGLSVWSVGYAAAKTRWRGNAMVLPERGQHVLQLLLTEPRLATGDLILVGHSMGGLIIKQMLRLASDAAPDDPRQAEFFRRVRKLAFIATPHLGSGLANQANRVKLLLRPSVATAGLVENDPFLQDLHRWYVRNRARQGWTQLVLRENRGLFLVGLVVSPESASGGDPDVIGVDADHVTITRVSGRDAPQYRYLKELIHRPWSPPGQLGAPFANVLTTGTARSDPLPAMALESLGDAQGAPFSGPGLLDAHFDAELDRLRKLRFLDTDLTRERARQLGEQVLQTDSSAVSADLRARVLAWCARILVFTPDRTVADRFLSASLQIARTEDGRIAAALEADSVAKGLEALSDLRSPAARTAGFALVNKLESGPAAVRWLAEAGLTSADLDADGRFLLLTRLLEMEEWDRALEEARRLEPGDLEAAPATLFASAVAELASAAPPELRATLLAHPPFEAKDFPLGSDADAMTARRKAQAQFEACAAAGAALGSGPARRIWDEYALWLALRDQGQHERALEQLRANMSDPELSLRRLYLALQFGLAIDVAATEAEIERQAALTGGASLDASFARFTLAFIHSEPAEVAAYIARHRVQLLKAIPAATLGLLEVEMLARSGRTAEAQAGLEALGNGLTETQRARLQRLVAESQGQDPVEARVAEYRKNGEVSDLVNLVRVLEDSGDWERVRDYGLVLFERTRSAADALRYVEALTQLDLWREASAFLRTKPDLIAQSQALRAHWAWALFREGDLAAAHAEVAALKGRRDGPGLRLLRRNLAIFSGAWETLLTLVEEDWAAREAREPEELLQAAQVASMAGSPRARELVMAAVARRPEDPGVLTGAYGLAVRAGWEGEPAVGEWLRGAAELSGEDGPLQKVSLQELVDQQPDWESRQKQVAEAVAEGRMPLFLAAKAARRTLLEIFLLPALRNRREVDPRRRMAIPAFTGSRPPRPVAGGVLALDVTALMTLGYLQLLDAVLAAFGPVRLAHSTLGWLFAEKERVGFHQPSRVAAARELRDLLATRRLSRFTSSAIAPTALVREVGADLAAALAEARAAEAAKGAATFVVRPYPVHKLGSLMEELADLQGYERHVVGCGALVDKLVEQGQLPQAEAARARNYLALQEGAWPESPTLPTGATVILDDVALSHFQHLDLLARLPDAGIAVRVDESQVTEADALLAYEGASTEALQVIEAVRRSLAEALQSGRAILEALPARADAGEDPEPGRDPTLELVRSTAETLVVDDRALNRHERMDDTGARIATTLDVLEGLVARGALSQADAWAARTLLRQGGFQFVDLGGDELAHYARQRLEAAAAAETAELRAVRESLLQVRMGANLALPGELPWLLSLSDACLDAVAAVWEGAGEPDPARAAASDHLLGLGDLRAWLHRFSPEDAEAFRDQVGQQRLKQLIGLQVRLGDPATRRAYLSWLDDAEIKPLQAQGGRAWELALAVGRDMVERLTSAEASPA